MKLVTARDKKHMFKVPKLIENNVECDACDSCMPTLELTYIDKF